MYGGHSGSQGLLIFDKTKTTSKAVYGYYEGEQIVLRDGCLDEVMAFKKQYEAPYQREKGRLDKAIFLLMFLMLAITIVTFIIGTFLQGLAMLVFCIGSYMPILIIFETRQQSYKTDELHQQFRRFHGCEHASVNWLSKYAEKEGVTLEKLRKMPIYDGECGTAYSGYLITLAVVVALLIANITTVGLLKAVGVVIVTLIVLLVNIIINPYNPYILLQKPVVAQPTDREYLLGIAVIQRLQEK